MSEQPSLLHLLLIRLKPGLSKEACRALLGEAAALAGIDRVHHSGAVEASDGDSTHSLALFLFLSDRQALEEFGAHPTHIRFLRATLAPLLESMSGADVGVEAAPPADYGFACCFGAMFAPDAYDWQVRAFLDQVRSSLGPEAALCAGLTLDERQAFRAAGVLLCPEPVAPDALKPIFEGHAGLLHTEVVIGSAQRLRPLSHPGAEQ